MKTVKTNKEVISFNGNQFAVNPDYVQERTGNYDRMATVLSNWEFGNCDMVEGCGNCHHNFHFDTEKQTFIFSDKFLHSDEKYISLYKIMSPALLLYRLISTFFGSPQCDNGYKSIWHYTIKHKESGKLITFSEWKGAIGFWLPETTYKKLSVQFRNDLIDLMNYIISNECAHPYDNLVAGSVA